MKYFFKIIRLILQPIILFIDWVTRPSWPKRSEEDQKAVDEKTSNLAIVPVLCMPVLHHHSPYPAQAGFEY